MDSDLFNHLELIFNPKTVAVAGASNSLDKWGAAIFNRLLDCPSLQGLYPINKRMAEVQGVKTFPTIMDVPGPVDFVAIAVPPEDVLEVIRESVAKGVKAGIIITAGFGETGSEGAAMEREIVRTARAGGMRLIGPNCNGHLNTSINFSTLRTAVNKGEIAVVSQSGGFASHILRYGTDLGVGFSKFVAVGNEADLHFEDFLEYLGQDNETKLIAGYIEGLRKGRDFFRLAKEITRKKPIIVVKVGRTEAAAKAARSHTSAIAGSDAVYDAMFKQAGVIRVDTVEELFDTATALLGQPLPKGNRIGILSSGGGFGCVTSDACARLGLNVAPLSPATIARLSAVLSSRWPHGNPVDTVASGFVTYPCLWPLIEDDSLDAVLAVDSIGWSVGDHVALGPAGSTISSSPLEEKELQELDNLFDHIKKYQKPVIPATRVTPKMRNSRVFQKLKEHGITICPSPDRAAKILVNMLRYSRYLNHSTPG